MAFLVKGILASTPKRSLLRVLSLVKRVKRSTRIRQKLVVVALMKKSKNNKATKRAPPSKQNQPSFTKKEESEKTLLKTLLILRAVSSMIRTLNPKFRPWVSQKTLVGTNYSKSRWTNNPIQSSENPWCQNQRLRCLVPRLVPPRTIKLKKSQRFTRFKEALRCQL